MNRVTSQIRNSMWDRVSPSWPSSFYGPGNNRGVASVISRWAWNAVQARFRNSNMNKVRIRQMILWRIKLDD